MGLEFQDNEIQLASINVGAVCLKLCLTKGFYLQIFS